MLNAPGEALPYRVGHINLIRHLAASSEMADLVNRCLALSGLAEKVRRRIELALLRREYILYRCNLCPGQVKK